MKKTKSTLKHHKQASWVKFVLVGVVLSIVALVVAGLQYGVGPVAQMTGKSPSINKLTEVVTSGKPQEKKTTVTLTQTEAQERRGTGTVTNTETGQVIRHTDNVENPFSAVPKATSYCSSAKEKECSAKGQRCVISVTGGVCQDIPGTTVTQPPTTITATGASCAGKWTSIGSGSWAQWGGTKDPNTGVDTGKQVCVQCLDGVWQTSKSQACDKVPYIPRPDEVIEQTVSPDQLACFVNGTWYSTGSNTGTQTCSKGHWCDPGQEWNGTDCVTAQTTNTTSSSQYQPQSCTPGNTWCEGNNLGTCTATKSKSYSYCPNTSGMTCVESSSTKAECKLTGSASTGNIALSYACGSGAGGTKLSIEKQSNGVTIYRQCDSKGCGSDGKCVGTTLGPINPNQPPATVSNPTSTTSTFACGSNSKGAISTEKKSDGTSVVHQCGTKGCNTSTGKCADSVPATQGNANSDPTSTLTSTQHAALADQSRPWSALNPMKVNSSADCPAGSTITPKSTVTATGFKTTYECTPKFVSTNQQPPANVTAPATQATQPTNPSGVISKPVISGNTSYSCNGSTAVVTDKASNTIMNTTQCLDLGCNPNTGKCNEEIRQTNGGTPVNQQPPAVASAGTTKNGYACWSDDSKCESGYCAPGSWSTFGFSTCADANTRPSSATSNTTAATTGTSSTTQTPYQTESECKAKISDSAHQLCYKYTVSGMWILSTSTQTVSQPKPNVTVQDNSSSKYYLDGTKCNGTWFGFYPVKGPCSLHCETGVFTTISTRGDAITRRTQYVCGKSDSEAVHTAATIISQDSQDVRVEGDNTSDLTTKNLAKCDNSFGGPSCSRCEVGVVTTVMTGNQATKYCGKKDDVMRSLGM